jgi:Inositol-pentakisphosphate 2-kinase
MVEPVTNTKKPIKGYKISQELSEHPALKDPSVWVYYNEGNNNVILRYSGKADKIMSGRILRIRKSTNKEYYSDPTLLDDSEYNPLMTDYVFMKDPILSKRLQSMDMVKLEESFLRGIDERISQRDMTLIQSESKIDFSQPIAMLATNFASFHEIGDDPD